MDWTTIVLSVLGGGSLTTVIGYVLWGKAQKKQELERLVIDNKTAEVGTKVSEANYTETVQDIYKDLAEDLRTDREFLKTENAAQKEEFKIEREYFRTQIDAVRLQFDTLQAQFNSTQLAYSREIEISQNWQLVNKKLEEKYTFLDKKHNILESKYIVMESEHEALKKEHDILSTAFDKYKKNNKV